MVRIIKGAALYMLMVIAVRQTARTGTNSTGSLPIMMLLWGRDIHYRMTLRKAKEAGFDDAEALHIAEACNAVDTSHKIIGKTLGNYWHHLDPLGWLPFRKDRRIKFAEQYMAAALATGNVKYLGTGLHGLQDMSAHHNIPFQRDLPWLKKYIGTWRDDPVQNPEGAEEAEEKTQDYLRRYLSKQEKVIEV